MKIKKLVIFTYNGTAFLNSLKANVPSIIMFDKNYVYLKKSTKKIYYEMKKIIYFLTIPKKLQNLSIKILIILMSGGKVKSQKCNFQLS